MRSSVAAARQVGRIGQPGHQQAHATQVEDGVAAAERVREHTPRFGCGQIAIGHHGHEGQVVAEGKRRVHRDAVDGGRRQQAAEDTGGRVLGVAVVGGGHGEGVVGSRGGRCRRGQRGRGPHAAGDRDLRAHRDGEAVVPQHLGDDAGGQV